MGNRKETKKRILNCAVSLFLERGYKGVLMKDISDAAGVTKGLLTHYYPRKEDLVVDLNYQNYVTIQSVVERHAKGDAYLKYLLTNYFLRKKQYSDPRRVRLSKEVFLGKFFDSSIESYSTHDQIFFDILKQFNINIPLPELHTRIIMGIGAMKEVTHVYLDQIVEMELDTYIEYTLTAMSLVLDIPAIIRSQYSLKLRECLEKIPPEEKRTIFDTL